MIQALQIKLVSQEGSERIEIASGDFLGHEVGALVRYRSDSQGRSIYGVCGREWIGLTAALNAAMAAAYEYVARMTSEEV